MSRLRPLVMALLFVCLATPSLAWSPDGVPVCGVPCAAFKPRVVPDGSGGAFIGWLNDYGLNPTGYDIYLQRLGGDGSVSAGWPVEGLPVCIADRDQYLFAIAPDLQGGVFAAWTDQRVEGTQNIYVQRVNPDGTLPTGWAVDGNPAVGLTYETHPAIAPDGAGGVFVAWLDARDNPTLGFDLYAQHLLADGTVAPGWPANGVRVCGQLVGAPLGVARDDSGGVMIVWPDLRRGGGVDGLDVYGQRLTGQGTIAPGWVVDGLNLAPGHFNPVLLRDEAGGVYLASSSVTEHVSDGHLFVQRLRWDATPTPGWPDSGLRVCGASGNRDALDWMVPDGAGGVLLAWYDYRAVTGSDVYVSRVLPQGVLAPGWPEDGLLVSDPTDPNDNVVVLTADGSGGAYLVWEWYDGFGTPSRVQHIRGDATIAPGWPQYGQLLNPSTSSQTLAQLVTDGAGGAIVVWEEDGGCCSRIGLFAQRYVPDGVVATALALVSAEATPERVALVWSGSGAGTLQASVERRSESGVWEWIGTAAGDGPDRLRYEDGTVVPGARYAYRLRWSEGGAAQYTAEAWVTVPRAAELALAGFTPNPAVGAPRVALTLGGAEPARLEVVDAGGRLVERRALGGSAGRQMVEIVTPLRPGLYWLRLTQGSRTLVKRGVVVR